jgi:hypothetical protein
VAGVGDAEDGDESVGSGDSDAGDEGFDECFALVWGAGGYDLVEVVGDLVERRAVGRGRAVVVLHPSLFKC